MLKNKPFVKFITLFALIYAGFLFLNSTQQFQKVHESFYSSIGGWVFNSWHPNMRVDITDDIAAMGADPSNDYVLKGWNAIKYQNNLLYNLRNPLSQKSLQPTTLMAFKSRTSHGIATFFLLALIWATPNKWYRILIGSIIGLYLLYILVAMKLTFLMEMADGSRTSEDGLWYAISGIIGDNSTYQELYYILILTIWMLVAMSKDTLTALTSVVKPVPSS